EFDKQPGVNVLYGLRYNLTLLRRGDRDHALVGFYGHLAQGMTRDTFVGGEGSRFLHGDKHGRSFYLPPNTASNATFLTTLRYLLIQDWDLDDDGRPETLRLCDAIPPRWLAPGKKIVVTGAPTAFGPVSLRMTARANELVAAVEAPPSRAAPHDRPVRRARAPADRRAGAAARPGPSSGPGGAVGVARAGDRRRPHRAPPAEDGRDAIGRTPGAKDSQPSGLKTGRG